MPKSPDEPQSAEAEVEVETGSATATGAEETQPGFDSEEESPEPKMEPAEPAPTQSEEEWWSTPQAQPAWSGPAPFTPSADANQTAATDFQPIDESASAIEEANLPNESVTGGAYFCGDTRFFSLNWALQTIAKGKLTGSLRSFWNKEPVDLLAKDGLVILVTTRDPEVYCPEAPITLVNVDSDIITEARAQQRETGCPLFITLAEGGHILHEPAVQLVQHYGQKLFAQLWTAHRVRFVFEQRADLPDYASDIPAEPDVDHWTLATLRLIQFQDLGDKANYDPASIPAYTRDGFDRVQNLRLTVAEAQFASQFNGIRSIQQIAKNLRLDLKFARLTLFRFLALEIVECWAPSATVKPERKGVLQRLTRTIGIGE